MAEFSSLSDFLSDALELAKAGECSLFGRILSWAKGGYPTELSQGRLTTFLFGEDAVRGVGDRVTSDPFGVLMELGLKREYVKWKIEVAREDYWLVLFRVRRESPVRCFPATWEGIGHMLAWKFPEALNDFNLHRAELSSHSCEFFEKESGIDFMRCLQQKQESDAVSPYFSYARYLTCAAPRSCWQVRLFLYCELRILEFFTGDGYTLTPDKKPGYKEYVANSINLSLLPADDVRVVPLHLSSASISNSN